jgi:hypothetical protein
VIAARDVTPPVSIGLFGDWGTGKTFFMKRMERWIENIKRQVRAAPGAPSAYCKNIVQLWFNAWHYIDANLWASLTSEIFEGLGRQLEPGGELTDGVDDPERARARLLAAAASAKDVLAEAERKKADAEADAEAIRRRLESLRASEKDIGESLVNAAVDVAVLQPEIKKKIDDAARKLGLDELKLDSQSLRSQLLALRRLGGFFRALRMALTWRRAATLGVSASALALALYLGVWRVAADWTKSAAAAIVGFLVPFAPVLAKAVYAKRIIAATWKKHKGTLAEDEAVRKAELTKDQAEVHERVEATQRRLEEAQRAVADLERRLDDLRSDAQMAKFVAERRESTDYTRHLGVVARARRDFERLSELLGKVHLDGSAAGGTRQLPQIDRIVLYIDDLDRCPEDKVVDVLQAVHLLLAFPLFIVVVGVDSRWLLHSLKQRAAVFRDADRGDECLLDDERVHWRSTPLNYLEKIFQIPFSLRPMPRGGFERLIETLAPAVTEPADADATARAERSRPAVQPVAAAAGSTPAATGSSPPPGPPLTLAASPPASLLSTVPLTPLTTSSGAAPVSGLPAPASVVERAPSDSTTSRGGDAPLDLNPAYLRITADEQRFMKAVFELIPSPRAAKRFVNVYRLLRASVPEDEWTTFLGEHGSGECRAVLLLLAIVTGYPAEATEILRDVAETPGALWPDFMARYRKGASSDAPPKAESARWTALLDVLERIEREGSLGYLGPCTVFTRWAPRVARYSFESGRLSFTRSHLAPPEGDIAAATPSTNTGAAPT